MTYQDLVDAISFYEFDVAEWSWNVFVSDGLDTVWSSNGPADVFVDIQGALNIEQIGIPKSFALHQNYPNPFNPATTFEYDLPKTSNVILSIYDITGREINQIKLDQKPAGRHRFILNGADLGSGVYFLHFRAGSYNATQKMMLIK